MPDFVDSFYLSFVFFLRRRLCSWNSFSVGSCLNTWFIRNALVVKRLHVWVRLMNPANRLYKRRSPMKIRWDLIPMFSQCFSDGVTSDAFVGILFSKINKPGTCTLYTMILNAMWSGVFALYFIWEHLPSKFQNMSCFEFISTYLNQHERTNERIGKTMEIHLNISETIWSYKHNFENNKLWKKIRWKKRIKTLPPCLHCG